MAFYTSRVDDSGNEIERRHSARTATFSLSGGSTRKNLSSRSCDTKSSVRYVNPAAFIEKASDHHDVASLGDENKSQAPSESQSDIVPPLDLQSEDNYPTTRDYTFSYRKHCEAAKIVLKPDLAYETWLSAKRKLISDEASRRKKAEEQKRKEQEERKRLSEEKFQQWLEQKSQQQQQQQSRSREKLRSSEEMEDRPSRSQLSEEEARMKRMEWERAKQMEEERRRILKREQDVQRQQLEEKRRQLAAEAWEKWLADAANKPKPVPLNRGIFTLRGTVSDIFVNPNEWQSVATIQEED